jgi:hypothetical protein
MVSAIAALTAIANGGEREGSVFRGPDLEDPGDDVDKVMLGNDVNGMAAFGGLHRHRQPLSSVRSYIGV